MRRPISDSDLAGTGLATLFAAQAATTGLVDAAVGYYGVGIEYLSDTWFARIRFASNATGIRRIRIMQNGSAIGTRTSSALGGGDSTDTDISDVAICASGDTFTLEAYQTSGGNLAADGSGLTIVRIAPVV